MKFTIKNNFFKEKKGKIFFSREIIIYEINGGEEKIFQRIDFEDERDIKRLGLYIKKLKNFNLEIIIDDIHFKKFEITGEDEEILKDDTEKYIEYSVKEFLNEKDLKDYFIKYFKNDEKKYSVFVFERDFVEELVEFFVESRLNVEKIIIKDEDEYILNDYDSLLHGRKKSFPDKKTAVFVVISAFLFLSVRIYNFKIEKEISVLNQKILAEDKKMNEIKLQHDNLEKEILILKEKLKENQKRKEYFSEKILKIFENLPENITVENIYFEKNILNVKGISAEEKYLFDFLEFLEKNRKICEAKYDYIIKKENFYEFVLEMRLY